eukprot:XP_025008742.1 outer dense fiber protein 2-like isoform X10 [Gallus gallus]
MWGPRPDKHGIKITELFPLLKGGSPKNHLPQNLNGSVERRCASDKERREEENASHENGASQEIFEAEMAINSAENLLPTFKDILGRMTNQVCKPSTSEMIIIDTQEDLLVKELTTLKTTKRLLWLLLQTREQKQIDGKNIEALIQKLSENETHNTVPVLKEEYLSRPVNTIEAHLQYQIQRKEVENDELRLKTQEVKLSEILSASDVWKKQHDRMVEEKTMLAVQTEDLKKQITSLSEDLKRKEELRRKASEELLGKLNSVNSENEKIYLENEKLKACLAALEISTVSVENDLLCLQEKTKLQENIVEDCKNQVRELKAEVEVLKSRYKIIFSENKSIRESKCLEVYEEEDGVNSVGNCSLEEENSTIQKKYEHLKRILENMQFQNEELAYLIKKEDESLQCSKLQLEEKIAEYNSLTKQLESALEEGRKMVAEEFEKMSYLEQALQTKMLILENEVRERQEEKKELLCAFHRNEKHHEVCLKELENSLQRSENKKQSIQNYVQFLKTSYITMFG